MGKGEIEGVGRGTEGEEGDRVGEERGERKRGGKRKIEGVGRGTEGDRGGGERDSGR